MKKGEVDPQFWPGKRVLLTGHTGFKGSWLSLWLQSMGAQVRGIALEPPTEPALFNVACVAEGMDHCIADIRDYSAILPLFKSFKPEIVIHMAAQPLVRLSYSQPIETYATNVMGTVHVLEASRQTDSVKALVNVTTDKCYENREWVWGYRENEPMGGHDPYSSSKGCSELVSNAYRLSFLKDAGIALGTARAGNVIGGGDWAQDRLIPDILRALEKKETVIIRNPDAIRPWQHVLEPLSGYLLLAQNLYINAQKYSEAWNFGPCDDDAKTVKWIVDTLCKSWSNDAKWSVVSDNHLHEAKHLKLDINKSKNNLNWMPRWQITMGLAKTIEWHKAWLNRGDMRLLTLNQITAYNKIHPFGF